ncbi:MAG: hypothetical protein ABII18_10630 [bacterium]|nr:hypothetical protein [bacterium]MBU1917320.1 hypothetical protein [bacterium]
MGAEYDMSVTENSITTIFQLGEDYTDIDNDYFVLKIPTAASKVARSLTFTLTVTSVTYFSEYEEQIFQQFKE